MSQYFHDAGISLYQGSDNIPGNTELDAGKFLPARIPVRIVGSELLPMDILFYFLIRDHHFVPLPFVIFPDQQARIVELDADATLVEIALLFPPAKAAVERDPVEGQELDHPSIPANQQVSAHP